MDKILKAKEEKMKLAEEDTSKVMGRDFPEHSEYSYIIYAAQDVGKAIGTGENYEAIKEPNGRAWSGIMDLMAHCIARGMRLAKEVKDGS